MTDLSSIPVQTLGASFALLLLAGCAVGPDFKKPAAPNVNAYTAQPLSAPAVTANVIGGDAQRFVQAADISGDWWTAFHSPALNALVEQALKNNSDLKAAQAALRQRMKTPWPRTALSFRRFPPASTPAAN